MQQHCFPCRGENVTSIIPTIVSTMHRDDDSLTCSLIHNDADKESYYDINVDFDSRCVRARVIWALLAR